MASVFCTAHSFIVVLSKVVILLLLDFPSPMAATIGEN